MPGSNGALAAGTRETPALRTGAPICQLGGDNGEDSNVGAARQSPGSFTDQRSAALALLNSGARLTRQAGSFAGQLAVDPTPLTEKQRDWLGTLLERADLPPLDEGGR